MTVVTKSALCAPCAPARRPHNEPRGRTRQETADCSLHPAALRPFISCLVTDHAGQVCPS